VLPQTLYPSPTELAVFLLNVLYVIALSEREVFMLKKSNPSCLTVKSLLKCHVLLEVLPELPKWSPLLSTFEHSTIKISILIFIAPCYCFTFLSLLLDYLPKVRYSDIVIFAFSMLSILSDIS